MRTAARFSFAVVAVASAVSMPVLAEQLSSENIAEGVAGILNEGSNQVHAVATGRHVDVHTVIDVPNKQSAEMLGVRAAELREGTVMRSCTMDGFRHTIDRGVDYTYTFALRSPETTTEVRVDVDAISCAGFDAMQRSRQGMIDNPSR